MVKMPEEVRAMFNDWGVPKVIATVDAGGKVNVVPVLTFSVVDEETLAFANQTLGKFDQNAASQQGTVVSASAPWRGVI